MSVSALENADQIRYQESNVVHHYVVRRRVISGRRVHLRGRRGRAGERRSTSSSTRHVVLAFLVSSLIGLLQLKYQNKSITPFDTHPATMATCLTSLCAYCLANEAEAIAQKRRAKHHSRILGQLALVLGALSSVLLASVFMSSVVARLFCVVWVVLLLAVLGIHLIQSIYQWLYQRTAMSVSWVLDLCTRLGRRFMQQQDFPV